MDITKLGFLTRKPSQRVVNGELCNFYVVSLSFASELRGIAEPLVKALSVAMTTTGQDAKTVWRKFGSAPSGDDPGDANFGEEAINEAITVDLARFRASQREDALRTAMAALTDRSNHMVLVRLIVASMRDTFPKKLTDTELAALLDEMGADTMAELLEGVWEANKKLFGPFLKPLEGLKAKALSAAKDKLDQPGPKPEPVEERAPDPFDQAPQQYTPARDA